MTFDAGWLDLREQADRAARDPGLLAAAAEHLGRVARPVVLDLGAGTGATVRAFGDAAPRGTVWRLVDRDKVLLRIARQRCPRAEVLKADLGDLGALPFDGARLVTASALLDLTSREWIEQLADRLAASGAGFYAALSYDGGMAWEPPLPEDPAIRRAFNAHQRRDKGLGPALGPAAAAAMAGALRRRGFEVRTAPSPWRLAPAEVTLQAALVEGIAGAAVEQGLATAAAWAQARRAASGSLRCTVGHTDVLALPTSNAQSKITSDSSP